MANRVHVNQMDKQELCIYLMEQLGDEVADKTLKTIEEEEIHGKAFLTLNDQDLHEVIPLMGKHKLVELHLDSLKSTATTVAYRNTSSATAFHGAAIKVLYSKVVSWQQCNKSIPSDLWRLVCINQTFLWQ